MQELSFDPEAWALAAVYAFIMGLPEIDADTATPYDEVEGDAVLNKTDVKTLYQDLHCE